MLTEATKKYGIKSAAGAKVYAQIHHAIESFPGKLKVERIREGADPKKIAIIGRSMGNPEKSLVGVSDVVTHFKAQGIEVRKFEPSDELFDMLSDQQVKYNKSRGLPEKTLLPDDEIVKTDLYKANANWAKELVDQGYSVLDLENPNKLPNASPFYNLERKVLFGE